MKRALNISSSRSLVCSRNSFKNVQKTFLKSGCQNFPYKNYSILQGINHLNTFNSFLVHGFCKNSSQICWSCQNITTNITQFFCDSCGIIQDVNKNIDYFKVLSLEENFNIDITKLTKKFRILQSMVHPDKYSNKSEKEQDNSQEWSSLINKAYKTIQTPIERGEYLLKLKGIPMPKDNSSLNKEFLMEMMERNEEVEDAGTNELEELLQKIKSDMIIEENKLKEEFQVNNYESAKFILVKMKYFKSLEKSIKEKLEKNMEMKR